MFFFFAYTKTKGSTNEADSKLLENHPLYLVVQQKKMQCFLFIFNEMKLWRQSPQSSLFCFFLNSILETSI